METTESKVVNRKEKLAPLLQEKSLPSQGSTIDSKKAEPTRMAANMKYISLLCLVIQNATLILSMRYARTMPGDQFYSTVAVMCTELLKIFLCLIVVLFEVKGSIPGLFSFLNKNIIQQPRDTLMLAVPSAIYMVQNNLLYVAVSNLPAATYQVTYQLKILTTALFSVSMLGKKLSKMQWFSMMLLFCGVAIVQLETSTASEKSSSNIEQNHLLGLGAVIMSCCSSGFAGVYFERILKESKGSIWLRNIQLGIFGVLSGLAAVFMKDGDRIAENGFFFGFHSLVVFIIMCQAFGGLLVAVVIKYADNILKGFSTSISIVVSTIAAVFLFSFNITLTFMAGAALVIAAVCLYSRPKPAEPLLLPAVQTR